MLRLRLSLVLPLVGLAVLLSGKTAHAQIFFTADLTNAAENPPAVPTLVGGAPRPASFGTATFFLNAAQTSLTFTATIFNIDFTGLQTADVNDNLTNAHIHAGPGVTPTTNGGVVWGFIGAPFNDNNPNDVVVTPFTSGVGGTVTGKWDALEGNNTTLTAQLGNILNNRSYINFHTTQFAGGEVRGNITVVAPEPSSLALLASSLGGGAFLGLARYRARRRR